MFIKKVLEALRKRKINYALAGGYAVALHGAVRGTVDVDLLVHLDEQTLVLVEEAMRALGLVSRIPVTAHEVAKFRLEYIEKKNLKVWSFTNPNWPTEVVDIMILYDLRDFKTVIKKSVFGDVSVVALPDLVRMKEAAGRPQDLADIEALKKIAQGEDA